jgi:queuosine biosynthesis protein QueC
MRKKAVVLLSGGLDSSVNAFITAGTHELVLALTFNYGQRAAVSEIRSAAALAKHLGVRHQVVELPWFKDFNRSSLLVDSMSVPTGAAVSIDDQKQSEQTAKSVWVPNRNGIFLNIAAAYAEALDAEVIVPGFNKEEAATFPDNSQAFLDKITDSLYYSTANHVKAECFTTDLVKTEIVKKGEALKLPWKLIWPCYFTGDQWCGQCESCQRGKRAFAAAGVDVSGLFKA